MAAESKTGNEHYLVDLTYFMIGQTVLEPIPTAKGILLPVKDTDPEFANNAFVQLLSRLDKDKQCVCFFVREDSKNTCEQARLIAEKLGFDVQLRPMSKDAPLKFGVFDPCL